MLTAAGDHPATTITGLEDNTLADEIPHRGLASCRLRNDRAVES